MTHLLDTDTCIHLLRGTKAVVKHAEEHNPSDLVISSITHYELLYGVERCPPQWKKKEAQKVLLLLSYLSVLPFTSDTAAKAAIVRSTLDAAGHPIGAMDVLIAATALEHNLSLVTHNLGEFRRIPGLESSSWC